MSLVLSEDWDIQSILEEFIQGLDNLPSEIQFIFDEISQKDVEFQDLYKSIRSNDSQIRKILQENPNIEKEESNDIAKPPFKDPKLIQLYELVSNEFRNASQVMDSKIKLAENSLEVLDKHVKLLEKHIERGESEAQQQQMNMSRSHSNANFLNMEPQTSHNDTSSLDLPRETRFIHSISFCKDSYSIVGRKISANGTHIKIKQIKQRDKNAIDGEEAVYCYCHQVSYGEMIACDNEECPNEWFHLDCVGLSEIPTGVWYCFNCRDSVDTMKKNRH